jgi:bifunctional UDP-N-acetylglucosamine pyrophosphorylase / glucosamine-1-phosphate N-acetyltransferase
MSSPTVLVLAAGQGTRMRSALPKVLHELCGRPLVLWPVRAALEAHAEKVIVVDSPERALAQSLPDGVQLAVQERPNGTGGAVAAGLEGIDSPLASGLGPPGSALDPNTVLVVLSGDVPLFGAESISELFEAHARSGAAATMVTATLEDPGGYGRVVRDPSGAVERVVETKREGDSTAEEREIREVNTGIYAFQAGALLRALPRLSAENAQGELYLPEVLALLKADGQTVAAHPIEDATRVLGVNDRVALAQVRRLAQRAIHERHMRAGVSIVDPSATVIDVDVQIGKDSVIEPFTTIKGSTRIGERCTVKHSYLIDCVLEDGVSVGPFAYLRPGTVLHEKAKAGTFVELKNSEIGAGTKIPHLSYIGDADVGEGRDDHCQLRRAPQAPDASRQPRAHERRYDAGRSGRRRRRCVHGCRLCDNQRCAARSTGRRAGQTREHRGILGAAEGLMRGRGNGRVGCARPRQAPSPELYTAR